MSLVEYPPARPAPEPFWPCACGHPAYDHYKFEDTDDHVYTEYFCLRIDCACKRFALADEDGDV